jgi:uncharacterized protein involved in response to NO
MESIETNDKPSAIHPLLAFGFRPFFLASGFYAIIAIAAWLAALLGLGLPPVALNPIIWHGHEMLYGFAAAAIAGFLLTVTPKWVNASPVRGSMLAGLVAVWLAGRIVHWTSALLPIEFVAVVDLSFVVLLTIVVARPILASGNKRQLVFVPILGAYWLGNLLIHLDLAGIGGTLGFTGMRLGAYALVILVVIMGGRIIPSFTSNYFKARGTGFKVIFNSGIDKVAMLATPVVLVADLFLIPGSVSGSLFLALALVHFKRLLNWYPLATRSEPLLWVLHTGYAWLAVSFALIALADLGHLLPRTAAFHGLTVGAVGCLMLAVMSRAGLGHTGRPTKAPPAMVLAYGLINAAALMRVIALAAPSLGPLTMLLVSGALWIGAFALFVCVYTPILTRPRVDGQAG